MAIEPVMHKAAHMSIKMNCAEELSLIDCLSDKCDESVNVTPRMQFHTRDARHQLCLSQQYLKKKHKLAIFASFFFFSFFS